MGLPFFQAFNVILDYKNSLIGFGEKVESKILKKIPGISINGK